MPQYEDFIPNRRGFLQATAVGLSSWMLPTSFSAMAAERPTRPPITDRRPRIAAIVTEYRPLSHADVIVGRFLQGHVLTETETYAARTQIVSMYTDQVPENDLSRPMSFGKGVSITPTIREALTLGTDKLAVDGVLLIGEHGQYPHNEKGQHQYPRRRLFEAIVQTFREVNASAPVFNDKGLGYAWEDAKWMYDQSRLLQFPLMAGSSLPTTWRKPDLEIPLGTEFEECLAIGYGGLEAYGFHALETLQCLTERRRGGETGVKSVTCLEGADVWKAAEEGRWSRSLLDAALACVDQKATGTPEQHCKNPELMLIEYADGLKASVVHLDGYCTSFGFAGKIRHQAEPVATLFWLQEPGYNHFSYLTHNIETMFLTGEETYPPERTLLTTGILDTVMTSRFENHRRIETPGLQQIHYSVTNDTGRRARWPS